MKVRAYGAGFKQGYIKFGPPYGVPVRYGAVPSSYGAGWTRGGNYVIGRVKAGGPIKHLAKTSGMVIGLGGGSVIYGKYVVHKHRKKRARRQARREQRALSARERAQRKAAAQRPRGPAN